MLPFDQGYRLFQSVRFRNILQEVQKRFSAVFMSENQIPRFCLDDPVMRPDAHQCLLYKLATCPDALQSSRRIQFSSASVRTPVSARQVKRFPSQTQIWEDNCNRPNAILDKTRRGEELQPSGRQGNTVLTPVLIMEIGCS
jgi:hypothetical protein